jgi:LPXTG-site transpeptidase (sortase) family protein
MKHKSFNGLFICSLSLVLLLFITTIVLAAGSAMRISVSSSGVQANGDSLETPSISADGRYVAFESAASNLVAGDTNGSRDIFVRDITTNETTLVSVGLSGAQADGDSYWPSISADGRYVAFYSFAGNLVTGDTFGTWDIFIRDRTSNTTTLVSVSTSGAEANNSSYRPSISADGRYVAFDSLASNLISGDTNSTYDIFVRDTTANTTTRISVGPADVEGNGISLNASISADGRHVVLTSNATNLVTGDTNSAYDIFMRDIDAGTTTRVSVNSSGVQGNNGDQSISSISTNGRYVAFYSPATNLVVGDTNDRYDIFVRDTVEETTRLLSFNSNGDQGDNYSFKPSITPDGRYVAFSSVASNMVSGDTNGMYDIFVTEIDNTSPTVSTSAPANGATILPINTLLVTFSEEMKHKGLSDAANNTSNYLLLEAKGDGFQTAGCTIEPSGDDTLISIESAVYELQNGIGVPFQVTLGINGGISLPVGSYRLFICGMNSVQDITGNKINGGLNDTVISFTVANTLPNPPSNNVVGTLPQTGFAPDRMTVLPSQPANKAYTAMGDLWLEIPSLNIQATILGVPTNKDGWDLTWLGNKVGWLQGTVFPTWAGNSALTAHVVDADGQPGLFANLNQLGWGDKVIVHAWGQSYIYEVRSIKNNVRPNDTSAIKHEEFPWLTLITCKGYDSAKDSYRWRVVVRAVQVRVE